MDKEASLSNLIAALQIILKYGDIEYPTHCDYDVLMVLADYSSFSKEDIKALKELGFNPSDENGTEHFRSYRYGS